MSVLNTTRLYDLRCHSLDHIMLHILGDMHPLSCNKNLFMHLFKEQSEKFYKVAVKETDKLTWDM